MADTSEERDVTEGQVKRVLFSNEENGWSVVRLQSNNDSSFTAIGPLLGIF